MSENGVEKQHVGGVEPHVIRAACRERFYKGLEFASNLIENGEAKNADRLRALDTLGRFGLGAADQAAVHIHGDVGGVTVGVVHLPALDVVDDSPAGEGDDVALAVKLLTSGEGEPT